MSTPIITRTEVFRVRNIETCRVPRDFIQQQLHARAFCAVADAHDSHRDVWRTWDGKRNRRATR